MCGRYSLHTPPEELLEHFGLTALPEWEPRYNIAPTQDVPIVRQDGDGRTLTLVRWGLIPFALDAPPAGAPLINARSETVDTKPSFRWAFRRRRCLVPADGFFEWKKDGRARHPYYVTLASGRPFAFAGVWDRWVPDDRDPVESCTILTTEPNQVAKPLHDRMPVILPPSVYDRWLASEAEVESLHGLLVPFDSGEMIAYPVDRYVNKTDNEGPACIARISAPAPHVELDLFDFGES